MRSQTLSAGPRGRALDDLRAALERLIQAATRLAEAQEPLEHRCVLSAIIRHVDAMIRLLG